MNLLTLFAPVAQLDRAPDFGSGGLGFESLRAYFSQCRINNVECTIHLRVVHFSFLSFSFRN